MLFNSFISLGLLLKSVEVEEMTNVALFKAFLCVAFGLCSFTLGLAFEGIVNNKLDFKDGVVITFVVLIGLLCAYKLVTL